MGNLRAAAVETLINLGKEDPCIVVLTADLGLVTGVSAFGDIYPKRYFDVGIAEQNLVSVAAGLALEGWKPFICTFAVFVTMRAFEQIRSHLAYQNLAACILGFHAGISAGANGATHQSLEDLNLMRIIPNMRVYAPCDGVDVSLAIKHSISENSLSYIRLSKPKWKPIIANDKGKSFQPTWVERVGTDVTLISTGIMLLECIKAAEKCNNSKQSISVEIIHISQVNPLDIFLIAKSAKKTGAVVTVEEGLKNGGIGEAICAQLQQFNVKAKIENVAINNVFGESGSACDLFDKYGISSSHIETAIRRVINLRTAK